MMPHGFSQVFLLYNEEDAFAYVGTVLVDERRAVVDQLGQRHLLVARGSESVDVLGGLLHDLYGLAQVVLVLMFRISQVKNLLKHHLVARETLHRHDEIGIQCLCFPALFLQELREGRLLGSELVDDLIGHTEVPDKAAVQLQQVFLRHKNIPKRGLRGPLVISRAQQFQQLCIHRHQPFNIGKDGCVLVDSQVLRVLQGFHVHLKQHFQILHVSGFSVQELLDELVLFHATLAE
mmetsp:Transcript_9885/g.24677  ORF Transcript_9885/g.24677 Transcript_9885/m.24677 type:complete len:235 (+) Transcript_9885:526-1230(+)